MINLRLMDPWTHCPYLALGRRRMVNLRVVDLVSGSSPWEETVCSCHHIRKTAEGQWISDALAVGGDRLMTLLSKAQ